MRLARFFPGIFVVFLALAVFASQSASPTPAAPSSILPTDFGGWQLSGNAKTSADPALANPINPALLKEYGFTDLEVGLLRARSPTPTSIKAARFVDASGAYGAFTFYRAPQMITEKIGDQAASANERVLFLRGNILIDAVFAKLSAMSAAELRELATDLPLPAGNAVNPPTLPSYLPHASLDPNSIEYILGPIALAKLNAPLAAGLVDFNAGAEVVLGNYKSPNGDAALMVISYPTPQSPPPNT